MTLSTTHKLAQRIIEELGYQEHETSRYVTSILEKDGFQVTRGVAGMPTAFQPHRPSGDSPVGATRRSTNLPSACSCRLTVFQITSAPRQPMSAAAGGPQMLARTCPPRKRPRGFSAMPRSGPAAGQSGAPVSDPARAIPRIHTGSEAGAPGRTRRPGAARTSRRAGIPPQRR